MRHRDLPARRAPGDLPARRVPGGLPARRVPGGLPARRAPGDLPARPARGARPTGLALALLGIVLAVAACGDDGASADGANADGSGGTTADRSLAAIDGVVVEPAPPAEHVEGDLDYDASPPSGGPHDPAWQNCGFYEEPVREEHAVHSLEHGIPWIAFAPDLPDEEVEAVRDLTSASDGRMLAAPHPDLDRPVVVLAWEHRLEVDSIEDPRVAAFLEAAEPGDHAPEPGAPCSGAIGTPAG